MDITDLSKALQSAVKTGNVVIGSNLTVKAVASGKAQLAVIASNCPKDTRDKIAGVPVMDFPGLGFDLGTACGKPYPIAALAIVEAGESDILRAVSEK